MIRAMLALALVLTLALSAAADPPVFSRDGLAQDRARANDEGKIHVVYATATWCGPCQQMKKTTWVDDSVVEWLDANAVVTPLDVDRNRTDASRYRVRSMPTMMLFRGSTEIARTVGYKDADTFRTWLESRTGRGLPASEAEGEAPATNASVQDMLSAAREQMGNEEFDEAAATYAWLWDHMRRDRDDDELRRGLLTEQIGFLIGSHEAAREPFLERRNRLGSTMPPINADEGVILDWITLNGLLDEQTRTVGWVSSGIDNRVQLRLMQKHQRMLRPLLTEAGAWNEAAAVVSNPFAAARLELMELKKAQRQTRETGLDEPTLAALADLFAIAHTIDRAGYAERVSALVLRTEDTPEIRRALVSRAIDADDTGPDLAELIADDGSDEAEALRAQLDR